MYLQQGYDFGGPKLLMISSIPVFEAGSYASMYLAGIGRIEKRKIH